MSSVQREPAYLISFLERPKYGRLTNNQVKVLVNNFFFLNINLRSENRCEILARTPRKVVNFLAVPINLYAKKSGSRRDGNRFLKPTTGRFN